MKANMTNRSGFGSCMKRKHQLVIKQKDRDLPLTCIHANMLQLYRDGRGNTKLKPGASYWKRKIWWGQSLTCTGNIYICIFFSEEVQGTCPRLQRESEKQGFTPRMPAQQLWQPDIWFSYMSKYRVKCPALCTFDDLIYNPKREIIRTIGSRFLCAANLLIHSLSSQPEEFFISHFMISFHNNRLGLCSRAACYRYNENNQSRAVINHPVIWSIKTNSY